MKVMAEENNEVETMTAMRRRRRYEWNNVNGMTELRQTMWHVHMLINDPMNEGHDYMA